MRNAFFYAVTLGALLCASGCSRKVSAFSLEPEGDVTGSPSDPPIELKSGFKPDVRYSFHLETDNSYRSSKWKFGTDAQETHFETDYRLTVTNTTSKEHQLLDIELRSLAFQLFLGDETRLYFDSENRAVPMVGEFADAMRSVVPARFGAELSRRGTLIKVNGVDGMLNTAMAKKNLRKYDGYVRRLFSSSNIRHMVELDRLPEKTVRVGDKWHQTDDLDNGFQADVNYTFRGWQWRDPRRCALIEFEGTITAPKNKNNKTSVEDSKFYGRYWFDPDAGIVTESLVHEQYTWSRSKGSDGEKFPTAETISLKLDSLSTVPKPVASN